MVYDVVYGSFAKEQPINEPDFETVKNSMYEGLGKCMTVTQGLGWPTLEGYRGRQYKAHCTTDDGTELTEVMNIYLGKRHAYFVTVTWRSDDPEPVQDENNFWHPFVFLIPQSDLSRSVIFSSGQKGMIRRDFVRSLVHWGASLGVKHCVCRTLRG